MSDIAIRVEGLSKQYRIGGPQGRLRYKTIRESLVNGAQAPFRKAARLLRGEAYGAAGLDQKIWALKDVAFEVKEGEVVGIIGRNGAGKTTLLKILSRITEPTEGRVDLYGRVGSLLEVGTGFHPELTGRENIYLNGAILGMKRYEIERKFDEIVAFSEIEKFLDTPAKHYSSGMYVRLAFSVAAHLEPDILLVDEVLAVGDAAFQKKCLGKMGEVAHEGRTVLFVSHNMGAITRLCERALWIDEGLVCDSGPAELIVHHYLINGVSQDGERVWKEGAANQGVDEFKLLALRICNENGDTVSSLDVRSAFWVELEYAILKPLPFCRVGIRISTVDGVVVFAAYDADDHEYSGPREPGRFRSRCRIPGHLLNPGRFTVTTAAGITGIKNLLLLENVLSFDVIDTGAVGSHMTQERWGVIRPKLDWQRVELS